MHASFQKRAFRVHSNTHTNTHIEKNVRVNPILLFPLVIFPHFARRCEGRVAVLSSDAEKQNGGRHRSGALCFFLFFWAPNFFCILPSSSSSSSSSSWCYYHGRKRKRANYRENRLAGLSFFYASEIVLRSIPSRDDVFVRRVGGGGRRRSRATFFFALKKFYPRWREVFLRSLQVFAAKKTSLFCVCQRQKIY